MKNSKLYFIGLLALTLGACSDDDKLIDQVDGTVERGAILRTVSVDGGALDVLDPSAAVTITIEEQDDEGGALLSGVDIYVNLTDNTPAATTTTSEALLTSIPASSFTTGPFNLPRGSFSSTVGEMAATLGLADGDYNCGDSFNLRAELTLTDGRVFTDTDVTGTVSGGSFFSSPFAYTINLIAPLPSDDLFTGQYQLTTESPGAFGVNDYQDGVYTIESVNNTTKVIKDVLTFPAFGPFGPVDVEFQFICGEIVLTPGQSVGAGCNAAIASGPAETNATYDLSNPDDSDFVINFTSDSTSDCGTPVPSAIIRLTKI